MSINAYIRLALVMLVAAPVMVRGQQTSPHSPKALTPEQQAYQQQWKQWSDNRQKLQAEGKQIIDSERSREQTGACQKAMTTLDMSTCLSRELDATNGNLGSYEKVIRGLIAGPPQMPGQAADNPPGSLTPDQLSAEFDRLEQQWRDYRKTACAAAFHQFDGGTGGGPFERQCEVQLTGDHIRELDMIYGNDLHL